MKHMLLTILAILCIVKVQAQKADFEWSELQRNDNVGLKDPTLVFPAHSGFTTYSIEELGTRAFAPKIIHVTKFDAQAKNISTMDFTLPKRQSKDATLLKVIEGRDKLYVFSFVAIKKDKKNILYVQVYDNEAGTVSEIEEVYVLPIEKVNASGFFQVEMSQDKNTLAVLINTPFVKKTKEQIEVLIMDADLKTVSNSKHTLSFDSSRTYREELFVENDRTVTIVKKTNVFKKEPITSLITLKNSGIEGQIVSGKGFYVSDNKVISLNGKQYLVGFATDNAKPTISMGGAKDKSFFIYGISEKKLIKNQNWNADIVKRILGKGFIDLKVKDVLIQDSDIYLIGDCLSRNSKAIEGANFEYNYTYDNGPGVVVKLNVEGEVAYDRLIKYGEKYLNDMQRLGSFYPFLNDGKLLILANEKESVLKDKKIVMGYDKINAKAIVLHTFDDSGEMKTIPFWNSKVGGKDDVVAFAPAKTIKLENNDFYIYAYGNKYQSFGKTTIR